MATTIVYPSIEQALLAAGGASLSVAFPAQQAVSEQPAATVGLTPHHLISAATTKRIRSRKSWLGGSSSVRTCDRSSCRASDR